jgi:hypothetical protein
MRLSTRRLVAAFSTAVASTVLAGVGLVAWGVPAANATPVVSILSQSTYVDTVAYRHIVGEVQNNGSTNIEAIQLAFQFFDAANNSVGSDNATSTVDRLAPGEKSPFHEVFLPAAGYDHYTVALSAVDAPDVPNHNFTVLNQLETPTGSGFLQITGDIRNDNTTDADFVNAVFTFYNGNTVVNEDSSFVNDDTITPGGTSAFFEEISQTPAFTRYTITAESNSPAAPSASPSPTPSPSTSPSASPTATPGASPTASSTEIAPTVALGSAVISAGQRVTVTYTGTPGSTLSILSKTQPATAYTRISSVTLDASGHGTTSHAPTKNTRIMARTASGLASGQPLIQVRSVASINARRVGVGAYTFSGRVYPARNGRLVSLYRNGTLVAQGHTDATGVYSITKKLARGTFSFLVRTGNDTYNLGTSSPARTVAIS